MTRRWGLSIVLFVLLCAWPGTARSSPTAFRMTTLAFRDPHFYASVFGCVDITNPNASGYSINGTIQSDLSSDADDNGLLDLNELLVFKPLDQSSPGGVLDLVAADCTAPSAGTQCRLGTGSVVGMSYVNQPTGVCLAPVAGTTTPSYGSISTPNGNCFVTNVSTLMLTLAGLPLMLHDAQLGGVYSGAPATAIVNGLLMGFLSETDADATILPGTLPFVGGLSLSRILPGGTGNCAGHSDMDMDNGVPGWWMYLNYTASVVPYDDGTTGVVERDLPGVRLSAPHPNPSRDGVSIDYSIAVAGTVRAWVTDVSGRRVAELAATVRPPGTHALTWDGRDSRGARAPAGVYFIRAEAQGRMDARRVAIAR